MCLCVCLSGSHTFLVVTHSYVSQATHAFLGMLPLCLILKIFSNIRNYFLIFDIHFLILGDQFLILENDFLMLENTDLSTMACHIICFVSFRFVPFRFDLFRFVSFRSVLFRSVSFLFRFALYRDPIKHASIYFSCYYSRGIEARSVTEHILQKSQLLKFTNFSLRYIEEKGCNF